MHTGRDASSSLGLLFGGDANINNTLRPDSLELPWRGIQGAVQAADLFLINHEATVTDRPLSHLANPANASNCGPDNVAPAGCVKDLRTATAVAPTFKRGGVDFVALSNNHQIKYGGLNGSEGLRDTLAFFNGPDGLPHAGIGETPEDASKPATLARGAPRWHPFLGRRLWWRVRATVRATTTFTEVRAITTFTEGEGNNHLH